MKIATLIELLSFKTFRGRVGPEDRLAIEVATYLRAASLEGRLAGCWTHIPHEVGGYGKPASVRMALAKSMGLIAGSTDYVFVWHDGGGWIELKVKPGKLNPAQKAFAEWCVATQCNHAVCYSLAEVVEKLISWGALLPE